MTIPAFSMPFALLDDVDRRMLARDLTAAAESWPVLAGLAAAARDCADQDVLEFRASRADLGEVGPALEAMYEVTRANGAAVRTALLRLLASWQSFSGPY